MTTMDKYRLRFSRRWVKQGDCHVWSGARNPGGYGSMWLNGHRVSAHRLAWMFERGPIPDGMCVLHHCDNPSCVNVEHLFLGTQADNARDRNAKGRNADTSGTKNGNSRLSWSQVIEIRRLYREDGVSQALLADKYNVSFQHISRIVLGENWSET